MIRESLNSTNAPKLTIFTLAFFFSQNKKEDKGVKQTAIQLSELEKRSIKQCLDLKLSFLYANT